MGLKLKGSALTAVKSSTKSASGSKTKEAYDQFVFDFKSLFTLWNVIHPSLDECKELLLELVDSYFEQGPLPARFGKIKLNIQQIKTMADLEAYQWNVTLANEGLAL